MEAVKVLPFLLVFLVAASVLILIPSSFDFEVNVEEEFTFFVEDSEMYIDWGDGSETSFNGTGYLTHSYNESGKYNISIEGEAERISFYGEGENSGEGTPEKLTDVLTDLPSSFGVKSTKYMYRNVDFEGFDFAGLNGLSSLEDMSGTFMGSSFNGSLSEVDVSNVESMASMFSGAEKFNQDISGWDVSSVEDMSYMFSGASSFNQDVSGWDTSSLEDMRFMFNRATSFNQDLSGWDVSSVESFEGVFYSAESFNGSLQGWDTEGATSTGYMFSGAESFNRDISGWDVSSVEDMSSMFSGAESFGQDLSEWDVSNVRSMQGMFLGSGMSYSLSEWEVGSVTSCYNFYEGSSIGEEELPDFVNCFPTNL